ncbi:hypothetical protein [Pseudomonas sp. MWU12-2323]|uniref:hypothetical protein n=1 Tax=Pseudomonas sp. MWU12-2323 TaxID=2651296 RepID=UPI00128B24C2|nr:hypothetical protein [Pseudomonas sp. MWU12-2323]MPQ69438.1 hypothetical protein [Pseudomonas sp. MWU12-2323]
MKVISITGGPASGKSFLIDLLSKHCNLYSLEGVITRNDSWAVPLGKTDIVAFDHGFFDHKAIWWCEENNCPLIVAGQGDEEVVEALRLSCPELIELRLERDFGTHIVQLHDGQQVLDLSVEGLMAKVFDLAGVKPVAKPAE